MLNAIVMYYLSGVIVPGGSRNGRVETPVYILRGQCLSSLTTPALFGIVMYYFVWELSHLGGAAAAGGETLVSVKILNNSYETHWITTLSLWSMIASSQTGSPTGNCSVTEKCKKPFFPHGASERP